MCSGDANVDLVVAYESDQNTPLAQKGVKVVLNPGNGDFSQVRAAHHFLCRELCTIVHNQSHIC